MGNLLPEGQRVNLHERNTKTLRGINTCLYVWYGLRGHEGHRPEETTWCHLHNEPIRDVRVYLELHQVDVHVSVDAVLSHRVRQLRDSVAGRSQPLLDLRQVEDDLPVRSGVERRRFLWPETMMLHMRLTAAPLTTSIMEVNTNKYGGGQTWREFKKVGCYLLEGSWAR